MAPGDAVDLPHRAGAAALRHAKLTGHPARAALAVDEPRSFLGNDLQTEQGGRGHVDVGSAVGGLAIERDAEHLADISGRRLEGRGCVGQRAGGRAAELFEIEDAQHGAGGVEIGDVGRRYVWRNFAPHLGAGKAGDRGIASLDDGLGAERRDGRGDGDEGQQCGAQLAAARALRVRRLGVCHRLPMKRHDRHAYASAIKRAVP